MGNNVPSIPAGLVWPIEDCKDSTSMQQGISGGRKTVLLSDSAQNTESNRPLLAATSDQTHLPPRDPLCNLHLGLLLIQTIIPLVWSSARNSV